VSDDFVRLYLDETARAVAALDARAIDAVAAGLARVRDGGGRLFVLGVGGSAAHASHAVNDFRKLCGFEAYAPTDNVSELTARVNDDGWESSFAAWLEVSRLGPRDAVLVFSVGGGNKEKNVSPNLVRALELACARGSAVFFVRSSAIPRFASATPATRPAACSTCSTAVAMSARADAAPSVTASIPRTLAWPSPITAVMPSIS